MADPPRGDVWDWLAAFLETHVVARVTDSGDEAYRELLGKHIRQITSTGRRWTAVAWAQSEFAGAAVLQAIATACMIAAQLAKSAGVRLRPVANAAEARLTSAVSSLQLRRGLSRSWDTIMELVKWVILFVATGGVSAVSPPSRSAADVLAAAEQDLARPDEPIVAHPADPASLEIWVPPADPSSAAHASAEGCRGELLLIARRLPSTLLEHLVTHMSSTSRGSISNSSESGAPTSSAGSIAEARAVTVALLACDVGLRCPDSLRCVPTLRSVGQQRLTLKLVESLDVLAPLPFLLALDQSGGSLTAALAASMWHLKLARAMASALEQSLIGGWHEGLSGARELTGFASTHESENPSRAVTGVSHIGSQMRRRNPPSQHSTNAFTTLRQPFFYWTDSAAAVDKVLACLPPDDSAFHARRALQRRLFAAAHRLFLLGKSSYSTTQSLDPSPPGMRSGEESGSSSSSPRLPCAAVALVVVQLLLRPPSWALRSASVGTDEAAASLSSSGSNASPSSDAASGEGHSAAALARGLRLAQALSNGADPDVLLNPTPGEQQDGAGGVGSAQVSEEVRQLLKGGPPSLAELQVVLDHLRLARRLMSCLEQMLLAATHSSSNSDRSSSSSSSSGGLKSTGYFMGGSRVEGGVGAGGISSEASSALAPSVGCLVEGLEPWWSWQRHQASDAVTQRLKQSIKERQALEQQNKANKKNTAADDESTQGSLPSSAMDEDAVDGNSSSGKDLSNESTAFELDPMAMLHVQCAHNDPPPVVTPPPPVALTAAAARSAIKTAASAARCLDGRGRWLIPILDHALDKVTTAMAPHRSAVRVQLTGVKALRAILRARATTAVDADDPSLSSSSSDPLETGNVTDPNDIDSQVAVSPGCVRRCATAAVRALVDHCLSEENNAPNFDPSATTGGTWLRPGVDSRELLRAGAQLLGDLAQVQSTPKATPVTTPHRDQLPGVPPQQQQQDVQQLVAKARSVLTPGRKSSGLGKETANTAGSAAPEAAMVPAGASYAAVAASGGLSALADAMLVADSAVAALLFPSPAAAASSVNSSGLSTKELENALEDFFEVRRAGLSVFAKHDVLDAKALPRYGGKSALKACFAALQWTNRERTRLQRAKFGLPFHSPVGAPLSRQQHGQGQGDDDEGEDDEVAELKFEWAAPVGRPPGVMGQSKLVHVTPKGSGNSSLDVAKLGEGLSAPSEATSLAGLAVMATVQLLLRVAASDMLPLHVAAAERDIGRIQAEVGLHNDDSNSNEAQVLLQGAGLPGTTGVSGPAVQYVDTARWWFEQAHGLEHLETCLGSFGPGSTSAALDHAGQWARRTLHNHWPEYVPAVNGH